MKYLTQKGEHVTSDKAIEAVRNDNTLRFLPSPSHKAVIVCHYPNEGELMYQATYWTVDQIAGKVVVVGREAQIFVCNL